MRASDLLKESNILPWPEVVNKVNSAMKAMGWHAGRKDDNTFMYSIKGQMPEEFYMVIIENEGGSFFKYALGTVEEGDPYIDDAYTGSLPMTMASISELMMTIREGFGLAENLDEDWRQWAAGAALGAAAMSGGQHLYKNATAVAHTKPASITAPQRVLSPKEVLVDVAHKAGIKGVELTQFLAQAAHETLNFTHMVEIGNPQYFTKKYDIKHSPKRAKLLGNVQPGDGERFKGRGFLQITGRYNYKKAGEALGLPLEQQPELLERPDIAAKAAVWYWKARVQPKVQNFADTHKVTKQINPGMKGSKKRQQQFKKLSQEMPPSKTKQS